MLAASSLYPSCHRNPPSVAYQDSFHSQFSMIMTHDIYYTLEHMSAVRPTNPRKRSGQKTEQFSWGTSHPMQRREKSSFSSNHVELSRKGILMRMDQAKP